MCMKKYIVLAFVFILSLVFVSCYEQTNDGPAVVSTTSMIHDIVIQLGGDLVDATYLMGPGVDPHAYKATAKDIKKLTKADLIFYNGLRLEAKLVDLLDAFEEKDKTVAISKGISKDKLLESEEYKGFYDPHIWFDVTLWITAVEEVKSHLLLLLPEHKDLILNRFYKYVAELSDLDRTIKQDINQLSIEQRMLITAHDAFGYFGRAYNIEVVGLQGISTLAEVSTEDIQRVAQLVVERRIPTVFVESSVHPRYIKSLQQAVKALGHHVTIGSELYTDALGDKKSSADTYVGMIRHNVSSIVAGLQL